MNGEEISVPLNYKNELNFGTSSFFLTFTNGQTKEMVLIAYFPNKRFSPVLLSKISMELFETFSEHLRSSNLTNGFTNWRFLFIDVYFLYKLTLSRNSFANWSVSCPFITAVKQVLKKSSKSLISSMFVFVGTNPTYCKHCILLETHRKSTYRTFKLWWFKHIGISDNSRANSQEKLVRNGKVREN